MTMTSRVNVCEESGDWHVRGSIYSGGLGWMNALWLQWRAPSFPMSAALASPAEQAWAMSHFVKHVMGGYWPDQPYCTGGY